MKRIITAALIAVIVCSSCGVEEDTAAVVTKLREQIAGRTFVEEKDYTNSISFKTDGTCVETFAGSYDRGIWEIVSDGGVQCVIENYQYAFDISRDGDKLLALKNHRRVFTEKK